MCKQSYRTARAHQALELIEAMHVWSLPTNLGAGWCLEGRGHQDHRHQEGRLRCQHREARQEMLAYVADTYECLGYTLEMSHIDRLVQCCYRKDRIA
jgi:hypothetical protein